MWIAGRDAYHLGSSTLVFGYFGYLVALGIYERSLHALLVGTFAIFFYGGMIFGILPFHGFISWEGHLFGLIAGTAVARFDTRGTSRPNPS